LTQDTNERPHAAFYRLLHEAAQGGQAKVDALIALMQRTVFVVPWPGEIEGYRTLVNSQKIAALPIFTERSELDTAARRYGWLSPDGTAPAVEIGAREAFHHARNQGLMLVVVDIAADHCVEVSRDEIEPLLSASARRESSGPFAGAGRLSSTLMRTVKAGSRATPPPGTLEPAIRAPTPPVGSLRAAERVAPPSEPTPPPGVDRGDAPRRRDETPGVLRRGDTAPGTPSSMRPAAPREPIAPPDRRTPVRMPSAVLPAVGPAPTMSGVVRPSARLAPATAVPTDELLDQLEALLRAYPEVEWACVGATAEGPALGLRIDARVRQRVDEIAARIATATMPTPAAAVLLDDPQHFRAAKSEALVFYPWRRK
jgi:hypothetical protein